MTARKKVIVHPVLEIGLGVDTLLCTGDSLILDITQTEEACYHWQDGSTNPTFVVSQPGTYWVEVRKWGCTARGTIHVEYGIPEMNLGSDTVLCESDTIVLDAGIYHAQYLWSDQSTNRQLMVTEPGTYWVEVRKGSCLLMDTIKVDYIYYPNPNKHNIDTLICEDTSLECDVYQPESAIYWSDGSSDAFRSFDTAGTYTVYIENKCFTTARTLQLETENCDCDLLLPNVFTPNEDGFNDTFGVTLHQRMLLATLYIYNRWGNLIYSSSQPKARWNGTFQGKPAASGVYYWSVNYTCLQAGTPVRQQKKGKVTLLRSSLKDQ